MIDTRRHECKCGHDRDTHFKTNEKQHVDLNGQRSYEPIHAACLASFCQCEQYEAKP